MRLVKLSEAFDIESGVSLELNKMNKVNKSEGIPFVSRTSQSSGISAYVAEVEGVRPNEGHTLSVAGVGPTLAIFYQPEPYYRGHDVYTLKPKRKLTLNEMLYYCVAINYCLAIGMDELETNDENQVKHILHDLEIPSFDEIPNWVHEDKSSMSSSSKSKSGTDLDLWGRTWKRFPIPQLFEITGANEKVSYRVVKSHGEGNNPYVTTSASNNGVRGFYAYATEEGGVITFDSAVKGYCAYQAEAFSASDHVEKLIPRFPINAPLALFLVTLLNKEQFRYNYGRKCSQERMALISIKLPVNREGNPDWEFMENYIKSLPYGSNL